ncbi:MAG: DNA phosphorothioation system sulfurtransferase DndC [Gammaproteobacteria bacterium AqS3]|nr:DNA phosphorothioation system sulfurtransferase DndC [Gammaproteobacteria bacterium AqS3]
MEQPVASTIEDIAERYQAVREVVARTYLREGDEPWIVAYSGGKDSTLLLQLVWEVLGELPAEQRRRPIFIVSNDTLVESPLVIGHLKRSLEIIGGAAQEAGFPVSIKLTQPYINQTFWVNLIGRGYIPPTRNFRWCTDRMKIQPTDELINRLVRRHKKAVLLIGTRRSESTSRRRNMAKHGVQADGTNPHSSIRGCRVFAPLADLTDEDVWLILMQRAAPWGGSHRQLITLYRNAGGGECPLVLTKEDAPSCGTTSPRFGCWTCTVVQKDRSMRGLIASGASDDREQEKLELLADFREWLIALREDDSKRSTVRRNGRIKLRADGTPTLGPFRLETRREILRRLEALGEEIGEALISEGEKEYIEEIWRRDQVGEDARNSLKKLLKIEIEA